MNFATGVLAKGGKVVVTGLIGGAYSTAVAMFPLKAMTIEGTTTGTLAEAHELIDLVRGKNIKPPPIVERPLGQASDHTRRSPRREDRRPRRPDGLASTIACKPRTKSRQAGLSLALEPLGGENRAHLRESLVEVAIDDDVVVFGPMTHLVRGFGHAAVNRFVVVLRAGT